MSDGSSVKRTALECEVAWIGNYHPKINHDEWSKSEIDKLNELIRQENGGSVDWVSIAKKLGVSILDPFLRARALDRI